MAILAMTSVSIIIPTQGKRQSLLLRAIESARLPGNSIAVEVVVVANGSNAPHFSLPEELTRLGDDSRFSIKLLKTEIANASLARNLGIEASSGNMIRFLDDDDYLIAEVAYKQCMELWLSNADLSTYAGRIEDDSGVAHQVILPGEFTDYGCAVLGSGCPALTFASVYRASTIRLLRWNTTWRHTEDEDWMRRVLQAKDPAWICGNNAVGVWYQHDHQRLSKPYPVSPYYKNRAASILETVEILRSEQRLTKSRKVAAAEGLWSAVHGGFYFSPLYWTSTAKQAACLDPHSRPADPFFTMLPAGFPPILLEWLALPKRWLNHSLRFAKGYLLGWNNVRKIS